MQVQIGSTTFLPTSRVFAFHTCTLHMVFPSVFVSNPGSSYNYPYPAPAHGASETATPLGRKVARHVPPACPV